MAGPDTTCSPVLTELLRLYGLDPDAVLTSEPHDEAVVPVDAMEATNDDSLAVSRANGPTVSLPVYAALVGSATPPIPPLEGLSDSVAPTVARLLNGDSRLMVAEDLGRLDVTAMCPTTNTCLITVQFIIGCEKDIVKHSVRLVGHWVTQLSAIHSNRVATSLLVRAAHRSYMTLSWSIVDALINYLADCLVLVGDVSGAIDVYRKLADRSMACGSHALMGRIVTGVAELMEMQDNYSAAAVIYQELAEVVYKASPHQVCMLCNAAGAFYKIGNIDAAEACYVHALHLEAHHGKEFLMHTQPSCDLVRALLILYTKRAFSGTLTPNTALTALILQAGFDARLWGPLVEGCGPAFRLVLRPVFHQRRMARRALYVATKKPSVEHFRLTLINSLIRKDEASSIEEKKWHNDQDIVPIQQYSGPVAPCHYCDDMQRTCWMTACSCGEAIYCQEVCRLWDWPRHECECTFLAAKQEKDSADE